MPLILHQRESNESTPMTKTLSFQNVLLASSIALLGVAAGAQAQTLVSARATANATVQPAGPRTGANGTNFLNIEGANNGAGYVAGTTPGAFASYGVVDFAVSSFGIVGPVASVSNLNLLLREAPAAFSSTTSVPINFYLASDTTTSISNATPQGTVSPLRFQGVGEGITNGGQLGTLHALGTGTYQKVGANGVNGAAFNYALTLNSAGNTFFLSQLNNNGTLRIVITPGAPDSNLAATFGGATSTNVALVDAPRLSFQTTATVAPEPGTGLLGLVGAAVGGFSIARRRRQSADTK